MSGLMSLDGFFLKTIIGQINGTQVVLECKTWFMCNHLKGLCDVEGSFAYGKLVNKMRMELMGSFSCAYLKFRRIEDILSMKKWRNVCE
jgi:hypothetical protein